MTMRRQKGRSHSDFGAMTVGDWVESPQAGNGAVIAYGAIDLRIVGLKWGTEC